ncbi:MAG TPA: 2-phosphosulfolactate phosphatase [Bacteroidales bacterium]|nr:2-phosphosulfolactate phosphatase [Bacteroidales bacterium]HPS61947.1 2-phosphosulfolactate phosphatase [Bacteroidales bacterium]
MHLPESHTPSIEVCFTPKLVPEVQLAPGYLVVLVDILRATTSVCAAFENGVKEILPVATTDEARALKEQGYLVALEQDGKKLDFADFGNSAFNFTREAVGGRTLVYCTTNGTRALNIVKEAECVAIGAFVNLTALTGWLIRQRKDILILCSGWKNRFCLEDTLFAGALADRLIRSGNYGTRCDSTEAAIDLWNTAKNDLTGYIEKAAHRHRLKSLGLDDVIPYSLTPDSTRVVPVYRNGVILDENNH